MVSNLDVGDLAPDFDLPTDAGGGVRLKDLRGQFVVLFFYPKDDTSGCTAEAIAFNRLKRDSRRRAPSSSASRPTARPVTRSSNPSTSSISRSPRTQKSGLAGLRGVEREEHVRPQVHGGRAHDGADRPRWQDRRIWRKVKVPGHAEEVLAAARPRPRGAICEGLTLIMSKSRARGFAKCAGPERMACSLAIPGVERSYRAAHFFHGGARRRRAHVCAAAIRNCGRFLLCRLGAHLGGGGDSLHRVPRRHARRLSHPRSAHAKCLRGPHRRGARRTRPRRQPATARSDLVRRTHARAAHAAGAHR